MDESKSAGNPNMDPIKRAVEKSIPPIKKGINTEEGKRAVRELISLSLTATELMETG